MKIQTLVSKATLAITLLGAFGFVVIAPESMAAKDKKQPTVDVTKLQWPPAPEIARIRFVTDFHGQDIAGVKKQGFLEKLAGVEVDQGNQYLNKPIAVAADSKGLVYVADTLQRLIFVFDVEKKTLKYLGDKPPAALRKPSGLAIDDQDRVFVSDAVNHNITVFDAKGEVETVFGDSELQRPAGMSIDSTMDRIYVADAKAHKVGQFNLKSLKFERWLGAAIDQKVEAAEANKTMNAPVDVAIDGDGTIYVVDSFLDHILVLDTEGEWVRTIGSVGQGPGKFMRPYGIGIDSDNHLYVTDAFSHLLQVMNKDGRPLIPIGGLGIVPGKFVAPAGIAIDRFNRVIVADQGNKRIQVFRYITDQEAAAQKAKSGKTVTEAKK